MYIMYILYILAFGASLINLFEGFLPQSIKVGNDTFHRRGRTCMEFLLMRSFASYEDGCGDIHCSSIVSEPVSCPSKHTWIIFGALQQWLPLPRELGHCGILLNHYCLDGGLFSSLSRRCRQRHDLYYTTLPNRAEATRLKNKDLFVATLCGIHVTNNGFKWACYIHLLDIRIDMKQIFGIAASILEFCQY